jgi:nucleoside-diphosphate-sugar epimerase
MLVKPRKQAKWTHRAMRVLIIGGTGFIGQWIVRALVENEHEVRVFHRGSTTAALPPSVSHIHGKRLELPHFAPVFRAWAPDVVLACFRQIKSPIISIGSSRN